MPVYRSQVPLAPGATSGGGPPPAFDPALGFGWAPDDIGLYRAPSWWIPDVAMSDVGPIVPFLYPGVLSFVDTVINVDGTNTTDESANISNAMSAAASGSALVYRRFILNPSGGHVVKLGSGAVQLATKHHFIFDLNGCELRTIAGAAFNQLTAGIVFGHGFGSFWAGGITNFILCNGQLTQNNPSPGAYLLARESQANLEIAGGGTATPCHDGLIYGMTMTGAGGDNVKLGGTDDLTYNIHGYDNDLLDCGRMHYSVIYGHDHTWGTLGANRHDNCGYACIDIEPNTGGTNNDCTNIFVDGNQFGSWVQEWLAINGSNTTYLFDAIKVRNNLVTGGSLKVISTAAASRPQNVEISGNASLVTVAGGAGVMAVSHHDGLRIVHNTQPLSSGSLVNDVDCPGIVKTPNP